MTTAKQIATNQANSKKSTGAITNDGKAIIAGNAIKHGLFSQRLILTDENLDEYALLIDGLINSLNPVGTLEQLIVEKIAMAIWKQLRLTKAESASIELDRRMDREKNIDCIKEAIGCKWNEPDITKDELEQEQETDDRFNRKAKILIVAELLKNKLTAPISNELLLRYQAGVDNELYKAIEALRKQQEWRSKGRATLDAEVA